MDISHEIRYNNGLGKGIVKWIVKGISGIILG